MEPWTLQHVAGAWARIPPQFAHLLVGLGDKACREHAFSYAVVRPMVKEKVSQNKHPENEVVYPPMAGIIPLTFISPNRL